MTDRDKDKIERAREVLENAKGRAYNNCGLREHAFIWARAAGEALAILSEPSAEESKKVLLWDTVQRLYVGPGYFERTANHLRAHVYDYAAISHEDWCRFAIADCTGWVESWGEQPVSDGVKLDAEDSVSSYVNCSAEVVDWKRVTHFRLPVEDESAPPHTTTETVVQDRSSEFDWPRQCDHPPAVTCSRCNPAADDSNEAVRAYVRGRWGVTEDDVRRIVREEMAADHRRVHGLHMDPVQRSIHQCRADELEGG